MAPWCAGTAATPARRPNREEGRAMDVVYVALVLGLFGLSWAFVVLCERL
jgi:hypothetical protein